MYVHHLHTFGVTTGFPSESRNVIPDIGVMAFHTICEFFAHAMFVCGKDLLASVKIIRHIFPAKRMAYFVVYFGACRFVPFAETQSGRLSRNSVNGKPNPWFLGFFYETPLNF